MRLLQLLMEYDGLTECEAKELVSATREEILETGFENVLIEMSGVEPVLLFDMFEF